MTASEHRRQRQLAELHDLCRKGAVARAIDLAFEHLACFGPDDDLVVRLEQALGDDEDAVLRCRIAALRATRA
jgi:hypothetical protein